MKRGMLLAVGFAASGLLLCALCANVARELGEDREVVQTDAVYQLPCQVPGTPLTAQMLVSYDGPFMEDGSGEEVSGVTALVLYNDSEQMIRSGQVVLEAGETRLEFSFTCLPPDGTILVPEQNRSDSRPDCFSGCCGQTETTDYLSPPDMIQVEEKDPITLSVTNLGDTVYPLLHLYYKTYDSGSGMYVGGSTYSVTLENLWPGMPREMIPYRYVRDYARIVAVIPEM